MNVAQTDLPAILWDLDGTIIDSEDYWIEAEVTLAKKFDAEWTHEDGLIQVGQGLPVTAAALQEKGVDLAIPVIIDELAVSVLSQLQASVPWRPGALELLADFTSRGCVQGLVTMSVSPIADFIASIVPNGTFSTVVSGDTAHSQKPHPAPYLQAADALGLNPTQCIAIEDSPSGCTSAFEAGTFVVGVEHLVPLTDSYRHKALTTLAGQSADSILSIWYNERSSRVH